MDQLSDYVDALKTAFDLAARVNPERKVFLVG